MEARKRWRPLGEQSGQLTILNEASNLVIKEIADAQPVQRRSEHQLRFVEGQRSRHPHVDRSAIALEFPGVDRPSPDHPVVDAAVPRQIVGMLDRAEAREISGCRHHSHAELRSDFERNHVLLQFLAQPNSGIEPVRNDVAERIVNQNFDYRVWMRFDEGGKNRPYHCVISLPGCGKTQGSSYPVASQIKRIQSAVDTFQGRHQGREQRFAYLGRRNAAAVALEQATSELSFQPPDRVAEVGSRGTERRGGACEAPRVGNRGEGGEVIQTGLLHHAISFNGPYNQSGLIERCHLHHLAVISNGERSMIKKDAVWLITGCSQGLGRALAEQALAAGYRVVLTGRRTGDFAELVDAHSDTAVAIELDVTDPVQISAAVAAGEQRFGAIDVLVNNAGYGYLAAIEEGNDADVRALFETDLFAPINIIKAVLPGMRARRSGHIVNISSIGGLVTYPGVGYYNMVKAGVEMMSDALAKEVAPLGIGVTVVAPGAFRTNFRGPGSLKQSATVIDAYADTVGKARTGTAEGHGKQPGDPVKGSQAIITAVAAKEPPVHLMIGGDALDQLRKKLDDMRRETDAWEAVTRSTDF